LLLLFLCVINQKQKIKKMKKLINSLLIISATSLTFVACKKEAFSENDNRLSAGVTPNEARTSPVNLRNAGQAYILTRKADDSLSYYGDGRLAKVIHSNANHTKYS
jgi:hypothetical protein